MLSLLLKRQFERKDVFAETETTVVFYRRSVGESGTTLQSVYLQSRSAAGLFQASAEQSDLMSGNKN